jgi:hypothetical protein
MSILYVLFITEESLLTVYLLEVPDIQNKTTCTQGTNVAKVKCV